MMRKLTLFTVILALVSGCATTDSESQVVNKTVMETPLIGITAPIRHSGSTKRCGTIVSFLLESMGEAVTVQVYPSYDDLVSAIVNGVLDLALDATIGVRKSTLAGDGHTDSQSWVCRPCELQVWSFLRVPTNDAPLLTSKGPPLAGYPANRPLLVTFSLEPCCLMRY